MAGAGRSACPGSCTAGHGTQRCVFADRRRGINAPSRPTRYGSVSGTALCLMDRIPEPEQPSTDGDHTDQPGAQR